MAIWLAEYVACCITYCSNKMQTDWTLVLQDLGRFIIPAWKKAMQCTMYNVQHIYNNVHGPRSKSPFFVVHTDLIL